MMLWWAADVALLLVVAPAVKLVADGVLAPLRAIAATADEIVAAGTTLVDDLAAVAALAETRELVADTRAALGRYGAALDEVL